MSENLSASPGYHHGNLRRALLDAGLAALRDGSEDDVVLRELARQVGVTPTAVYRHFANKEALLVALAVEGFQRLSAAQSEAFLAAKQAGASRLYSFRAGGLAYIRFARTQPGLFRLMFGRFAKEHRDDQALAAASRENGELTLAAMRNLQGGQPSELELLGNCLSAWSAIHGLSFLMVDGQLDSLAMDGEALAELVLDSSVGGVLRAMQSEHMQQA